MIQLDPQEPTNYFALAEDPRGRGRLREGRSRCCCKAKEARPNDPQTSTCSWPGSTTARKSSRRRSRRLDAAAPRSSRTTPRRSTPSSTYYWDKAYRDFRLKDAREEGIRRSRASRQVDKALQLKPDYMEALTYKNLLLRLQANLEKDPAKQQALLKEADKLRDQALDLQEAAGRRHQASQDRPGRVPFARGRTGLRLSQTRAVLAARRPGTGAGSASALSARRSEGHGSCAAAKARARGRRLVA
ncbi:MAG: hypothetical protein M0C28_13275 [Candidatus Moduliflexus flocculans]|nr:hypothetical protein [Candidatus Moduliflexus flocculans]